jgi:glycine cleavage system H protein
MAVFLLRRVGALAIIPARAGKITLSIAEKFRMIRFSDEHVWVKAEGDKGVVGITLHAQETLGDIVFVELPAIGKALAAKDVAGVVESVKAAADVYSPVSGTVTEVNEALRADPSLANTDPQGAGWFFKLKLADASELGALMDEATYAGFAKDA